MLIDWFTVAAQTLNFLILVWLLKRFLFAPISKAIEERQATISGTLSEAAAAKLQAQREKEEFQAQKVELENRCDALLKEAVATGQAEKKKLVEDAHKAADAVSQSRLESLRGQELKLEKALRERAQEEALFLARDILRRLAGSELESCIVGTFLERLAQLEGASREALVQAIESGGGQVLIRSARELSSELREKLEAGVEKTLAKSLEWTYKTDSDLVNGFELVAEGHKIGWSGAQLLDQVRTEARLAKENRE